MTFEDAGLTSILREKVHTKVFKKEYLEWLTELELDRLPEDLEELKKLPNLTTLIIPGENDSEEEMRELSLWVAGLGRDIPLHITRFYPRFHMTDREATSIRLLRRLAEVAGENLKYVYTV